MSARTSTIGDLFREEISRLKGVFFAGKEYTESVNIATLSREETEALRNVFMYGVAQLEKIAPEIAKDIKAQESLVYKVAGVFKEMLPEKKSYSFPSVSGSLGVAWLFPQAIRYAATPSSSYPCYTSYPANSWNLSLTAGTAVYFFGDGTNFYKASPTTGQHSMILVFKNGVVEIGTTPKLQQFRLYAEGITKWGIYTVVPLVEIPIEKNKAIYQYPTPMGPVIIPYDKGVMWGAMPEASGTSTIKLLGLVFYEHDLFSTLTYVS